MFEEGGKGLVGWGIDLKDCVIFENIFLRIKTTSVKFIAAFSPSIWAQIFQLASICSLSRARNLSSMIMSFAGEGAD